MIPPASAFRKTAWVAFFAVAVVGRAAEPVIELDPYKVTSGPVSCWGIEYTHDSQHFHWLPPRRPYVVAGILKGSPADRAGVSVGDEITSIDGTGYRGLSIREAADIFFKQTTPARIKLELTDPLTGAARAVKMELDKTYTALRLDKDAVWELVYWGVVVRRPSDVTPAAVVRRHPRMPRDKRCVLRWGGREVTLIERPGAGVEIREGDYSRPSKEPPPAGRLLPVGTVLELRADGGLTINGADAGEIPGKPRVAPADGARPAVK